jgi:epoxyqueuosine reductase
MSPEPLTSARIKTKAREFGFDACGIAAVGDHPELKFFSTWLERGYAASMDYLERSADFRSDVRAAFPSARTVIMTATLYNTERPSTAPDVPGVAKIARYARGEDYHAIVGARLEALLKWMYDVSPEPFQACPYVDTGPIQERVYARHAGLGWIGKNTCVISPEIGSFVFLGEIICSLPLESDPPAVDQCGTCTLCIDACPTRAIVDAGVLDANRCISYLTIEHRGEIAAPLRSAMGSHIFGCDICQEVCPWNAVSPLSADPAWQPRPAWDDPKLVDLLQMSDDALTSALRASPMKRAKASGLRRNMEIAADNARR